MPFTWSASTTSGEQVLCCRSENILSKYKTVDEYWNCEEMQKVRLSMLAGEPLSDCSSCYDDEQWGLISYRQSDIDNPHLDSFFERFTEEELSTGILTEKNYPTGFDYRTQHCNLACQTCGPLSSTTYETKIINAEEGAVPSEKNLDFEMKQADDMIRAIQNKTLTEIYWAGGEPMMSSLHWKVMDTLYDMLETDPEYVANVHITYNTNLTKSKWKGEDIYTKLSKFEKLDIVASIDGIGNTYNYIRDKADWLKVRDNLKQQYNAKGFLSIQLVLTNLWILQGTQFLDFFQNLCGEKLYFKGLDLLHKRDELTQISLSPYWLPKEIMLPAIDEILEHSLAKSGIFDISPLIKIRSKIESGNEEYSIFDEPKIKKHIIWWDSFRKDGLTFGSVLQEINTEAWMWYNSI